MEEDGQIIFVVLPLQLYSSLKVANKLRFSGSHFVNNHQLFVYFRAWCWRGLHWLFDIPVDTTMDQAPSNRLPLTHFQCKNISTVSIELIFKSRITEKEKKIHIFPYKP